MVMSFAFSLIHRQLPSQFTDCGRHFLDLVVEFLDAGSRLLMFLLAFRELLVGPFPYGGNSGR
jgi:hypothetical protein